MLYRIRCKNEEYFLKFEPEGVRTVLDRHKATEFHLQEATDTLEKLKRLGIPAEICESIWGETKGEPFKRTPVEQTIPAEWGWLSSLAGKTADGRTFLKVNLLTGEQVIYAKDAFELVQKVDALADSFEELRTWLAQHRPTPEPSPTLPAAPPEPTWGYWITGSFRSGRFDDREQALNVAYALQQRGENVVVVNERGIRQR